MNLSFNSTIQHQPNFQARIKIGKPSIKAITQATIGTSALAAGAASMAEAGVSGSALSDANPMNLPQEVMNLHHNVLLSAGEHYDNAGVREGIPVQSTAAPTSCAISGVVSSGMAENASYNASNVGISEISVAKPIEAIKTLAANKLAQKSAIGTSYLGLAAASIYSGLHPEFEDMLPQSVQGMSGSPEDYADNNGYVDPYYYDSQSYKGDYAESLMSTGLSAIGLPTSSLCSKGLEKSSDTKSSQFVKETLTENKSNTNIPS